MRATLISLMKVMAGIAVVSCLILGVNTGIKTWGAQKTDARAVRIQAASAAIPGLVKTFKVRQPQDGLKPDVVWEGASADVLMVDQELVEALTGDRVYWTVLARTANGRFFRVQYAMYQDAACERVVECIAPGRFEPLSREEAKIQVFSARNIRLYEELFGEKMPPTEVRA